MSSELRSGDKGAAEVEVALAWVCVEDSIVPAVANGAVDDRGESTAREDKALESSSDLL